MNRESIDELELKPCPFCGGEEKLIETHHWSSEVPDGFITCIRYMVKCSDCGCRTYEFESRWKLSKITNEYDTASDGEKEAADCWNRRV